MRRGFLVRKADPPPPPPPNVLTCPTLRVRDLPPEITDRILEHLYAYPQTLRQCSLVCKGWVPRSRYLAFQTVLLRNQMKCKGLEQLLEANPALAYCIEVLHIIMSFEDPAWLSIDLPKLTKKFTRLYRVDLEDNNICLTTAFRGFTTVRELHLKRCGFGTFNEFTGTIYNMPSLEVLTCTTSLVGDIPYVDPNAPPISTRPLPKIRRIEFLASKIDSQIFVDWCIRDGVHKTLEELAVRPMQRFHLHNVGRLVRAIGPKLKRFEITLIAMRSQGDWNGMSISTLHCTLSPARQLMNPVADTFAMAFSLAPCTNLQTLTFGSPGGYSRLYHTDDRSCRWIESILSQVTSPHVSDISFWIDESDVVGIRRNEWNGILALLESSKFSSLKRVEMKLREDNRTIMDAVESYMKRKLAKLNKDGVLVFVRDWTPPNV